MDYNTTKCPVCGKLLGERRLTRYPGAVVCGWDGCSKQHRRNQHNKARNRYYARRYASDPAFRERELQYGRDQYKKKRLAAGKTVTPRARIATERTALYTFLSTILRNASGGAYKGSAGGSVYLRIKRKGAAPCEIRPTDA